MATPNEINCRKLVQLRLTNIAIYLEILDVHLEDLKQDHEDAPHNWGVAADIGRIEQVLAELTREITEDSE
jgi:hypothetical protein